MMKSAKYWIEKLELEKHPEGGYYKEIYRSAEVTDINGRLRNLMTLIYYLLEDNDYSVFHRLKSDEIWHYHIGMGTIEVHSISPKGILNTELLGSNLDNNEKLTVVIPAGTWFAAGMKDKAGYSLVACYVSPGFDFEDFEISSRDGLLKLYPEHKEIIINFTR